MSVLHLWYVRVAGIRKEGTYTCSGTLRAVGRHFRLQVTMKSIIQFIGCWPRHAIYCVLERAVHFQHTLILNEVAAIVVDFLCNLPYLECIE